MMCRERTTRNPEAKLFRRQDDVSRPLLTFAVTTSQILPKRRRVEVPAHWTGGCQVVRA